MFNAEEIIELEKKWLKYKIIQKSKLYIFLLLIIITLSFLSYNFIFPKFVNSPKKEIEKELISKSITNKNIIKSNQNLTTIPEKELNKTKAIQQPIVSEKKIIETPIIKEVLDPLHFKLIATQQDSGLFSVNGFLTQNLPFEKEKKITLNQSRNPIIKPIREIEEKSSEVVEKKKKTTISIDMKEVDTISYLKDKYYSTSSIVFALMLAEEYYYEKEYENALKWALTANDIDAQNTKSWYWFAKAKVKLNKKEDAIRALKAYLSNNSSKRLNTLLHKIEIGDTDD